MAKINLLPWREKQREKKNKEFIGQLIVVTLISLLVAFSVWTIFNMKLEDQNEANAMVTQANVVLERKLKEIEELEKTREDIISRMKVIQDLQGKRPIPVHVLDSLVKTMPNNMYYSKVERKGDKIYLFGYVNNPNTVSDLLRNLDNTNWFAESSVRKINSDIKQIVRKDSSGIAESLPEEASYISFEIETKVKDKDINKDKGKKKDS